MEAAGRSAAGAPSGLAKAVASTFMETTHVTQASRPACGRRRLLLAAGAAAVCGAARVAVAQPAWPIAGQPIRIVVTQGPGAGSDVLARLLAHEMQGVLNHPVIVENRPGAAGTRGHQSVASATPDGHTLILSSTGLLLVTPEITAGTKVRFTDFAPIAGINEAAYLVLVPESPTAPRTLAQLRERLAAGRGTYGSSGAGTMAHLSSSLILRRAGLTADHIPYKANAQVLQDLAGGRLDFACDTVSSARPLIQGGRVRALAVTSGERLASLPEIPTLAEAGLPNTVVLTKGGLLAPRNTPPDVVRRLAQSVQASLRNPDFQTKLAAQETRARFLSPEDYRSELEADARLWRDLVAQMNIKAE